MACANIIIIAEIQIVLCFPAFLSELYINGVFYGVYSSCLQNSDDAVDVLELYIFGNNISRFDDFSGIHG